MIYEIEKVRIEYQDLLDEYDDKYILKTNKELYDIIVKFGCGETMFHTADIARLITQNDMYKKLFDNTDPIDNDLKSIQ